MEQRFVVCLTNEGFEAALEPGSGACEAYLSDLSRGM
jgi:hypothetical protein